MKAKKVNFGEDIFSYMFTFDRPEKLRPYFPSKQKENNLGWDVIYPENTLGQHGINRLNFVFIQFKIPHYKDYKRSLEENRSRDRGRSYYREFSKVINNRSGSLYSSPIDPFYKIDLHQDKKKNPTHKQHDLLKKLSYGFRNKVFYVSPLFTDINQLYDIYYSDETIKDNSFKISLQNLPGLCGNAPCLDDNKPHSIVYAKSNSGVLSEIFSEKSIKVPNWRNDIFVKDKKIIEETINKTFLLVHEFIKDDIKVYKNLQKLSYMKKYIRDINSDTTDEFRTHDKVFFCQYVLKKYYNINMVLYDYSEDDKSNSLESSKRL